MFAVRQSIVCMVVILASVNPVVIERSTSDSSTESTVEGDSSRTSPTHVRYGPFVPTFSERLWSSIKFPTPKVAASTIVTAPPPVVPVPPKAVKPVAVAPSNLSKVEIVIQFAKSQLGKPYVWAAAGPNAYDCSGLVMVAFSKVGLKLPHFTGSLIGYGRAVTKGQLQPGDIIFPIKRHVGIYLGDGMMINAPQAGDVVKIQKIWSFYAARRLL